MKCGVYDTVLTLALRVFTQLINMLLFVGQHNYISDNDDDDDVNVDVDDLPSIINFLPIFIVQQAFNSMPLSELKKKFSGMNFDIAAEEMRRLDAEPSDSEKLQLYGLYKQTIHGDIPTIEDYPKPSEANQWKLQKYNAWTKNKGKDRKQCENEYVQIAEEMITKYGRKIVRCKWNSDVWTVDY